MWFRAYLILQNNLLFMKENNDENPNKLTPLIKSMKGAFKEPKNFNYKKELTKILCKKYLK